MRRTFERASHRPSTFDVRGVANLILARARELGHPISNMALNKILYFVHCDYLIEEGTPLVGAKIEAWKHGPVFREIYQQFKKFGDGPVTDLATRVDVNTGEVVRAEVEASSDLRARLTVSVDRYVGFSAAYLRALSHIAGGPWAVVWGHDGEANPGMQITNDLILEHYSKLERQ